jgi:hypothetical protein
MKTVVGILTLILGLLFVSVAFLDVFYVNPEKYQRCLDFFGYFSYRLVGGYVFGGVGVSLLGVSILCGKKKILLLIAAVLMFMALYLVAFSTIFF